MTRQKVVTILGLVLTFECVAKAGTAQTPATSTARPSVAPKWNLQLQVTPTVPVVLKRTLF